LKNTRLVFNRDFCFDGHDYSLELYDGASNVAFTQTEAKKMGVSIISEVRNVNPTMTDSSDIAYAFSKTAKADILRNFADSFQAL